jgi:hypothetical protein
MELAYAASLPSRAEIYAPTSSASFLICLARCSNISRFFGVGSQIGNEFAVGSVDQMLFTLGVHVLYDVHSTIDPTANSTPAL